MSVASCDTSPAAWSRLGSRFDRDTGNTSILLFRSLTNLRYHDGDDLRLHMDEFYRRWTRMAERCAGSTQSVARAMKTMFESDEVKGSFFLATLPDTMDHVIDSLSSCDVIKFADIEPNILDISDKHSLDVETLSIAYAARQLGAVYAKRSSPRAEPTHKPDECTWCRKHKLTIVGHIHTNCERLRKHKEVHAKKSSTTARQRSSPSQLMPNAVCVAPRSI